MRSAASLPYARRWAVGLALACVLPLLACAPQPDPEVVAIQYLRAVNSGEPDTAVRWLDMEELVRRVDEQIIVVMNDGSDAFLRDSVETVVWGLFRQGQQADFAYDASPARISGERAVVRVTKTDPEGERSTTAIHLRRTDRGWRVSGESLDPLVTYVVQRLEERY